MRLALLDLPADEATDLVYSMIVDDLMSGRAHARKFVREHITNFQIPDADRVHVPQAVEDDAAEMRRTWGLLPEHQAALGRAVAITAGGAT